MELAAVVPNLLPDPQRLAPDVVRLRAQGLAAAGRVLEAAKRHGLVRDDVSEEQFLLGLGVLTRPLPLATARVPDIGGWLVGVYLRGLRPD
jgi:hypothetical protein